MSKKEIFTWEGASGTLYRYEIWELEQTPSKDQMGNYIFCRKAGENWVPIYVGQGDLRERTNVGKNQECIKSKGATHIHMRLNTKSPRSRLDEEDDLLKNHPEAYKDEGCNERKGG